MNPVPQAAGDLSPGALVGQWRIAALIGRGGTSAVYEVRSDRSGDPAALKLMRPEWAAHPALGDRFDREATTLVALAHPGVPRVYELGQLADGRRFLALELLCGRTLAAAMVERVSFLEAITILRQLCSVLAAAHARGIVHRDLKPDNVFLLDGAERHIKLVDWGIVKHLAIDDDGTALTRTGTIMGTPRYLAPEQARALPVDERADVYSLGLVAYELLVGVYPFAAGSLAEALMMQMVQPAPSPRRFWPSIPPELDRLLLAMLAKDPARRPPVTAVHDVLAAAVSAGPLDEPDTEFRRGRYDDVATSVDDPSPVRPTARYRRFDR